VDSAGRFQWAEPSTGVDDQVVIHQRWKARDRLWRSADSTGRRAPRIRCRLPAREGEVCSPRAARV